jgi:hypothetical protein
MRKIVFTLDKAAKIACLYAYAVNVMERFNAVKRPAASLEGFIRQNVFWVVF